MSNPLPDNHPLLLGQKILDYLQDKNDYNEHIIDEVINGYQRDAIINAIYGLSVADLVHFPNNDPATSVMFLEAGEGSEPAIVNYPVVAQLLNKES